MVALPWATSLVEFRILGPLEVVERDRPVVVGGPKVRALLAVLLLHRGEVVSTDRLIDALWGERASATAAKTVQVYVSNLRKALGDGLLVTRGHGYLLRPETGQVDSDRFEALVAEGRRALQSGDGRAAGERLREAWRCGAARHLRISPMSRSRRPRSRGSRRRASRRLRIGSMPTSRSASRRGWWGSSRRSSPSIRCASACSVS